MLNNELETRHADICAFSFSNLWHFVVLQKFWLRIKQAALFMTELYAINWRLWLDKGKIAEWGWHGKSMHQKEGIEWFSQLSRSNDWKLTGKCWLAGETLEEQVC